jgi:nucleotide-binding universal stress UspA family protein
MSAANGGSYKKILLATDGSEYSAGATRTALKLAANCGAQLRVFTMVFTNPEYEALTPKSVDKAEHEAHDIVELVRAAAAAQGLACDTAARHGEEPAQEIVAEANTWGADLIVMGRRGKRGLARLMVGDATFKVIGQARCAVLVVPRNA